MSYFNNKHYLIRTQPFIEWDQVFKTGIQEVDKQHHNLVNQINILNDMVKDMEVGRSRESEMENLFGALQFYIGIHFRDEEVILKEKNYAHFDAHLEQHSRFKHKLESLYNTFKSNTQSTNTELLLFLKDWLVNHIESEDKKFALEINKS